MQAAELQWGADLMQTIEIKQEESEEFAWLSMPEGLDTTLFKCSTSTPEEAANELLHLREATRERADSDFFTAIPAKLATYSSTFRETFTVQVVSPAGEVPANGAYLEATMKKEFCPKIKRRTRRSTGRKVSVLPHIYVTGIRAERVINGTPYPLHLSVAAGDEEAIVAAPHTPVVPLAELSIDRLTDYMLPSVHDMVAERASIDIIPGSSMTSFPPGYISKQIMEERAGQGAIPPVEGPLGHMKRPGDEPEMLRSVHSAVVQAVRSVGPNRTPVELARGTTMYTDPRGQQWVVMRPDHLLSKFVGDNKSTLCKGGTPVADFVSPPAIANQIDIISATIARDLPFADLRNLKIRVQLDSNELAWSDVQKTARQMAAESATTSTPFAGWFLRFELVITYICFGAREDIYSQHTDSGIVAEHSDPRPEDAEESKKIRSREEPATKDPMLEEDSDD